MNTQTNKLGLTLGGGSALGWAHVGVLKVIDEIGLKPDVMTGTSMGSIVGIAYAAGMLGELERYALDFKLHDLLPFARDLRFGGGGAFTGEQAIREFADFFGKIHLEDLPIPFTVIASDLATGKEVEICNGPVIEAIRASVSLPAIFRPVHRNEHILMDGGARNPVPIRNLKTMGATHFISCDVTGDYDGVVQTMRNRRKGEFKPNAAAVTRLSYLMLTNAIVEAELKLTPPDVHIVPRTGSIEPYAFHRAAEFFEIGENAARETCDGLISLKKRLATPGTSNLQNLAT